jgi:hypothetical protein
MAELKLGRLPDRAPVRLTISLPPDLNQALADYAALYEESYGRKESVQELVPAMLAKFLESDKAFTRRRRGQESGT